MIKEIEVRQEEFWLEKHFQISCVGSPVPVVSNMTTIHNLTKDVFEILPRNNVILGKIVIQDISTDS
jgi:hypothetical protein